MLYLVLVEELEGGVDLLHAQPPTSPTNNPNVNIDQNSLLGQEFKMILVTFYCAVSRFLFQSTNFNLLYHGSVSASGQEKSSDRIRNPDHYFSIYLLSKI